MRKTIYMIFVLVGIMVMGITMTGCSNPIKAENVDLHQEVSRVAQENEELKQEILQLQQKNQELDEEITKLDPTKLQENPDMPVEDEEAVLDIYAADVDTYQRETIKEVTVEDKLSIEDKLKLIADNLSKEKFEGLGIEVSKTEDQDGKKIGLINLTETSNETGASWSAGYFQGSTGGIVTSISLEETFLQREYEGEWIDGVRFLYEGEPIEFDHVEALGKTIYR